MQIVKFKSFFYFSLFSIFCVLSGLISALNSANVPQVGEEQLLTKGNPPAWINSPVEGEFVGVGQNPEEKSARNDALADARKQIIDSLGIEMSKESVREITTIGGSNVIGTSQSSGKIKTESVAKNILQVKPAQWYIEKWQKIIENGVAYYYKVYVLVKFSQEQHATFIDSLIQQVETLSVQSLESAKDLTQQGKTVESIVEYFNVANAVRTVNKITGIDPTKLINTKKFQREALQPIREFFGQTKVVSSETNIKTQPGDDLPNPIQLTFTYKDKPLSGMPVRFSFLSGSGEVNNSVITDQDGIAMTSVSQIQPAKDKDLIVIEGKPDVDLDESGVPVIRFNIDASRKIMVRVIEKNMGTLQTSSRVENALVQGLIKNKFKCIEPKTANVLIQDSDIAAILTGDDTLLKEIAGKNVANWILVGEATTSEGTTVQPGYVFARAYASVKVIRMDTMQTIVSDNFETKAAGEDFNKAGLKALDSVAPKFARKIIDNLKQVLTIQQ